VRVALVTCARFPSLHEDERPLLEALVDRGLEVVPWIWREPAPAALDAVLMRNPWDWYLDPAAFIAFLDRLPPHSFNAPELMRDYLAKDYLATMPEAIPTELVEGGTLELREALRRRGWARAVVKPALSANAHRTLRLSADASPPPLSRDRWLLQPFVEEVVEGELSLVFLDGTFSHAVRKRPAERDFRVQVEHGGTVAREEPSPSIVERAAGVVARLAPRALYARVDGVVVAGELAVMELELVEPQLFFGLFPEAADRLAAALVARLG
jgi:glutathione synthase/RimK-type ligase-like ATP-grasp enzyme